MEETSLVPRLPPPIGGKDGLVNVVDFLGTASTIWEDPIRLQDFTCRASVM